jgi:stearoyl-CoA desaturase (delta-9 desaturase)
VRQGFTLRQGDVQLLPDPTYRFIRLLQWCGWARDLRIPSRRALLARAAS